MWIFSKLFSREKDKSKKIKKFSTTVTSADEGCDVKKDLNPEIKKLLDKVAENKQIANHELNKLIEFYFDKKPILHNIYSFNKAYSDSMCFEINSVNTILGKDNDVENIVFNMREITFGSDVSVSLSIQNFHEFFNGLEITAK